MAVKLNAHSAWISACVNLLSIVVVLRLYGRHTSTAMKMPWIMLILAAPVMGLSLFLLFDILGDPGRAGKRIRRFREKIEGSLSQNEAVLARLESENRAAGNQFHYLSVHENWPVYENTSVRYFGDGAETLEAMKADLEKAEKFIFMEYFIVADNSAFQEIREILVRKARQGVEVRLMYDDIGSLGFVNLRFARGLSEDGIRCRVFNPAVPVVNLFLNHRDHRKTTVIDGKVGYIGGYNLSDEYFGRARPYGVWKDTGLRLEGEAVRSLTASFFELWNVTTKEDEDFARYLNICHKVTSEGFVQPFNDNPLVGGAHGGKCLSESDRSGGKDAVYHYTVPDHHRRNEPGAAPCGQTGCGRADHYAGNSGQKSGICHHPLLLFRPCPAGRADFRVYAGLLPCKAVPVRREDRLHRQLEL